MLILFLGSGYFKSFGGLHVEIKFDTSLSQQLLILFHKYSVLFILSEVTLASIVSKINNKCTIVMDISLENTIRFVKYKIFS